VTGVVLDKVWLRMVRAARMFVFGFVAIAAIWGVLALGVWAMGSKALLSSAAIYVAGVVGIVAGLALGSLEARRSVASSDGDGAER
jgi:hypothetical protein